MHATSHDNSLDSNDLQKPELHRHDSVEIGLKNYTKWRKVILGNLYGCLLDSIIKQVTNSGGVISRFVPMKLPYDTAYEEDSHNIRDMKVRRLFD